MNDVRIGFGYDFHKLIDGNSITLADCVIECDYSVDAHSDGDVVLHALSDAIYGSIANGDIGVHFPSNNKNKDIKSTKILSHAYKLLCESDFKINNIDITLVLESPHIQNYIDQMRKNISNHLSTEINRVSIKSSTSQKIGLIGNNQAIACYVSILVKK